MKKALAVLLSGVLLCLTLLSGCGGTRLYFEIHAYDFFSLEKTEFSYVCERGYGDIRSTPFSARDLDAIEDVISTQLEHFTMQRFPRSILLRQKEAYGTNYLLIQECSYGEYLFFGMGIGIGKIGVSAGEEGIGYGRSDLIFPFHLLDLQSTPVQFGGSLTPIEEQKQYRLLESTKDDFWQFYEESNKYTMAETADGFILTGYSFPNAVELYPPLDRRIVFHFVDTEDGLFCWMEQGELIERADGKTVSSVSKRPPIADNFLSMHYGSFCMDVFCFFKKYIL